MPIASPAGSWPALAGDYARSPVDRLLYGIHAVEQYLRASALS
jgi:hypothetical protein